MPGNDSMSIGEAFTNEVVFIGNNDTALTSHAQGFLQVNGLNAPALHSETITQCGCEMFYEDPLEIGCCDDSPIVPNVNMTQFDGELYPPGAHPVMIGGKDWWFEITRAVNAPTCANPNGEWDVAWALVAG